MKRKDYYSVLGLDKKATDNEIKLNYHKLVKLYHPDLKMGSDLYLEKFILINEAYSVLRNETSRKAYDLKLRQDEEAQEEVKVTYNSPVREKTTKVVETKAAKNSNEYLNIYKSAKKAFSRGEYVKALNDVKKTIELNKGFAKAYELKGDILYKYQNYKDALRAYETYTKYCPTKELSLVKSKIESCIEKKHSEKTLFGKLKRKLFY